MHTLYHTRILQTALKPKIICKHIILYSMHHIIQIIVWKCVLDVTADTNINHKINIIYDGILY